MLELKLQGKMLTKYSDNDASKAFVVDHKALAMAALLEEVKKICSEMVKKTADESDPNAEADDKRETNESQEDTDADRYALMLIELTEGEPDNTEQDPFLAEV